MICEDRPVDLGNIYFPHLLGTYLLYLPIRMAGRWGLDSLPSEMTGALWPLLERIPGIKSRRYVYLSWETSWVRVGRTQKRPGWHCDGFLSDDVNVIWHSSIPTVFNSGRFEPPKDHVEAMTYFEKRAEETNNYTMPNGHALLLSPRCVHRSDPSHTPGIRTFLKLSMSDERYNLEGNSHNPSFNYDWVMHPRATARNHPAAAQLDYLKQT